MTKSTLWKMKSGDMPLPKVSLMLGAKIVNVSPDAGEITMTYEGRAEFTNPMGKIQGGMLTAMLDDTMSLALLTLLDKDETAPTLELKINFIAPADIGSLTGKGRVISKGKSVCVLEGELRQEKRLIARSSATVLILKNKG